MSRPVSPSSAQQSTGLPSQAQAELEETARRPLFPNDAFAYFDEIRVQFHDQPAVYVAFLDLLKDLQDDRIKIPIVIERVNALFAGYPRLIDGFRAFLPAEYQQEGTTWQPLPARSPTDSDLKFHGALVFVDRVKTRFADRPDVYKTFLDVLQAYQHGSPAIDANAVVMQVALLFRGHDDLVEEFKGFINTNN